MGARGSVKVRPVLVLLLAGLAIPTVLSPITVSASNHQCYVDSPGHYGGTQLQCGYACGPSTRLRIHIESYNQGASVYGETSCSGVNLVCSNGTYVCDRSASQLTPNNLAGAGTCTGAVYEFFPHFVWLFCQAGSSFAEPSEGPERESREGVYVTILNAAVTAQSCHDSGAAGEYSCVAIASSCVPLVAEIGWLRCGVLGAPN